VKQTHQINNVAVNELGCHALSDDNTTVISETAKNYKYQHKQDLK
jgi:hypothetical protein